MLYFATRPDQVFIAIVDAALAAAANWIEDPERWQTLAHHVVDAFPRHEVPHTALARLAEAHRSAAIYSMSHFYWALLYDCLAAYVAAHNARIPKTLATEQMRSVGAFRVGPVDLPSIVATYCWDLWFFPNGAGDRSLPLPPSIHRARGGTDRYAAPTEGLAQILQPKWDDNPDAAELANPAVAIPRYPPFTAPAVLDAW